VGINPTFCFGYHSHHEIYILILKTMNGFSGNWSSENNGADFPGPGFGLHRYGFHQERIKTSQGLTDKDFTYTKYLF
jgi:hypothetical protein